MNIRLLAALFVAISLCSAVQAAPPALEVVVGPKADPLEKLAADEAAALLKKLYGVETSVGDTLQPFGGTVVVVGTPSSNPAFGQLKLNLPAVVKNDFAVKTYRNGERQVIAVVGANPAAVKDAAFELGWRLGVRYFTFGDLYPAEPPPLDKTEIDAVCRPPDRRELVFQATFLSPLDYAAWGVGDWKTLLRQLSKLRYRKVLLDASAKNLAGKETGLPIEITSDTMGRAAFQGAKAFDNAYLASASTTSAGRAAAATKLLGMIRDEGKRLGIEVVDAPGGAVVARTDALNALHVDYYLTANSRLDVDPRFSHHTVYEEILAPVCGTEVGGRVARAFEEYERATLLVNRSDEQFGVLGPQMFLRHFAATEPVPGWWNAARTHYLNAMNEMYRANTRAREGGRAFTLPYARKFEFAAEYVNVCESLRRAGAAKRKGDKETQITELEKAIDSATNCCNAMAAVARTPSDRAFIAVMNQHAYRPLLKLLEEVDAE